MDTIKTLNVYHQFNGDGITKYITTELELPNDIAEEVTKIVEAGKPIESSNVYDKLMILHAQQEDLSYFFEFIDEEPDRDDYNSDEEYQAEMEEYRKEVEGIMDDWCDCGCDIEDPGDITRLVDSFANEVFPEYALKTKGFDIEEYEIHDGRITNCHVEVHFSEDGHIDSVEDIFCEGLEWEDMRRSSWGECYPNYNLVQETIRKNLISR